MSRRPPTPAELNAACLRFNAGHKIGDTVTVYTGLIGENPKEASLRTEALILGGHTAGVYVAGRHANGFIALTHVAAAVLR